MLDWTEYGKELVLLTVDTFVLACAWKWFNNSSKAVSALERPVLKDHGALQQWLQDGQSKGKWAVLQGPVEPIGPIIKSFNDSSVKGVIQRLKVKELVTSRNTAGFWHDGERTITDTSNVVPFGIRVGRSLVEMEDPTEAANITLRTVASKFSSKSSGFLDHIWGFIIGTKQKGIQSTEEMLLIGTKVTVLGPMMEDNTLTVSDVASMRPYILSELTVGELHKKLNSRKRWACFLLLVAGCAGVALVGVTLRRAYRKMKDKTAADERRKRRFEEKRTSVEESEQASCIICDNPREVILLPCGHICLCFDCSKEINNTCPICRSTVERVNEYYIS